MKATKYLQTAQQTVVHTHKNLIRMPLKKYLLLEGKQVAYIYKYAQILTKTQLQSSRTENLTITIVQLDKKYIYINPCRSYDITVN